MTHPQKNDPGIPWHLIFTFIILTLAIGGAGYIYFNHQRKAFEEDKKGELLAISKLKVDQIARWREERLADGQVIMQNPFFLAAARKFLAKDRDEKIKQEILEFLQTYVDLLEYTGALLLDAQGKVRLSVAGRGENMGTTGRDLAGEVLRTNIPALSDILRGDGAGDLHLYLAVPLFLQKDPAGKGYGVILLRISPQKYLFPLIQTWPGVSLTAETLMIRREGDEIVFLNELRHRKNTALTLRFPVTKRDSPAAMAAEGKEGVVEGVDYRGVPVMAALARVPQSPWLIVTKVDREEIYGPLHQTGSNVAFAVFAFIAATGGVVVLFWRKQQGQSRLRQVEAEVERMALVNHYAHLTRYANDIIIMIDEDGRIVEMNERAVDAYGYDREELLRLNIRDLRPPEFREDFARQIKEAENEKGLLFETMHRRKDGTVFPVEINSRVVDAEGKKFSQSVIRDITERKQAEGFLRKALEEKEILLREVQHRVKNNLQIILSLLNLQAQHAQTPETIDLIGENQNRVKAMALIHEMIHLSKELVRIDFADYLRNLARNLVQSYARAPARMILNVEVQSAFLDIDRAIPCGLIVVELVSNALKHAFPGQNPTGRDGKTPPRIDIIFRPRNPEEFILAVRDNGIGLPQDRLYAAGNTLGLQLVKALTRQVEGSIQLNPEQGTEFTILFGAKGKNGDKDEQKESPDR